MQNTAHSRVEAGNRIDKEKNGSIMNTGCDQASDARYEEVLKHRIVVDPMIVVASANETLEVGAQSIEEVNRRDLCLPPKSSRDTPAISEGFELFFVITRD